MLAKDLRQLFIDRKVRGDGDDGDDGADADGDGDDDTNDDWSIRDDDGFDFPLLDVWNFSRLAHGKWKCALLRSTS